MGKSDDTKSGTPTTAPRVDQGGAAVADRAHVLNKQNIENKILEGPGSLDPASLAPPTNPDVRRWLAKRGFEMKVPDGWRFLGMPFDGRGLSFNHNGQADGHTIELTTWKLADDTPIEKFLQPYLEEAEELVRLGRLSGHQTMKLGDADGVLFVGWGPDTKLDFASASSEPEWGERLYLSTDGTGRRGMSWRGAYVKGGDRQLLIVSLSSPIESFFEARPLYDAVLASMRVVA